jgi:hypothetical protein
MSIKYHYRIGMQDTSAIGMNILTKARLILIIIIIAQLPLSFLIESSHFNFGKGEVMHN